MNATSRWFSGPSFLRSEEREWPCQNLLKHHPHVSSIQPLKTTTIPKRSSLVCVIDITRFINWNQLIRVTAYCFFYATFARTKANIWLSLSLSRHTFAYSYLIQIENFADEISALRKGKEISASSRLRYLCPYVDNIDQLRAKSWQSKAMALETV